VVGLVIDQIVDQAIAPRVLGGFTGLKPIWVLISLLLGTKIAGLAGLLTAVPSASFIKTLLAEQDEVGDTALSLNSAEDAPEYKTEKEPIAPL
jgi:predicted PurR-regulated permease PerM